MIFYVLLSLAVGVCVVLQGGFNRQASTQVGMATAMLMNGIVFLVACVLFYFVAQARPQFLPESLRAPESAGPWLQWRTILPGLFGAVIVLGIPWAMTRVGALVVILLVLSAQLVSSLVWDALAEGIPPTPTRLLGTGLALAGAALVSLRG